MTSDTGCRGWVCQFELGELYILIQQGKLKHYYSEEAEETTLKPIVTEVTEGPNGKDLGSPNGESHIGLWLLTGLVFGIMICLGVGLKKAYNFCKKGAYSILYFFFLMISIFRLKV